MQTPRPPDPYHIRYYASDTRAPDWHRTAVGGMWDTIGQLQMRFLLSHGLKSHHALLDIGCGSLRGGVHFVRYLNKGNYVGVDIGAELLVAGRKELENEGLGDKGATLICSGTFDFKQIGRTFDYVMAQSLFTHLPLNSIARCLIEVARVLTKDGRFYATYFDNPRGMSDIRDIKRHDEGGNIFTTHYDADPYHYTFETFVWLARNAGLRVERIGKWGHPREQEMMVFTRVKRRWWPVVVAGIVGVGLVRVGRRQR